MKLLKKHWRLCCALYALIYLPWFFILEKNITPVTPDIHILNTSVDSMIPFCEYFIVPYILWFVYIGISILLMGFKATDSEFIKFASSLIIGMSLCLVICMIYPNGLTLRPDSVPDNIFGKLTAMIYASDTPTNVFPSIHVYNSLAIHIALSKCEYLRGRNKIKAASFILCILICASTLFLKQHCITDVIGAVILMAVMYVLIYVIDYKKVFKTSSECKDKNKKKVCITE